MFSSPSTKMAWGSTLVSVGLLGLVFSLLLGWTALDRPWGFLIGFGVGLCIGLGATLAIVGLATRKREP